MSYEEDAAQYESEQHEQKEEEDSREVEAMRKMFVGGLNRETTEDAFFNYFEQFGSLADKVIIRDPKTQHSRGFGFITYEQSDSVEAVFKARPHELDGRTLDVKRAMPREFNTDSAHSKTTRLFIGGFKGLDLTVEELKEYLESRHPREFGTIESVDFLKEKDTDAYKGFGFIDVSDSDFGDRLAISESSFSLKGRTMSIKKAEPRNGPSGTTRGGGGRGGVRGGRGSSRGGRGGLGGGYSSRGGFNNNYNSAYSQGGSYDNNSYGNSGYNQGGYNQQQGGYNQQQGGYNQQQGGYNQQQGGYNQHQGGYNQQQGGYNQQQGGYNQSSYNNQGGGYSNQYQSGYGSSTGTGYSSNNYNAQSGYNQSGSYNNQGTGGRGGSRGGAVNNRYQPY